MNPPAVRRPGLADFAHVDVWIFDLDNTLYPARCNLFQQIDRRMGEFIAQRLAVSYDEAKTIQKSFWRRHGTTLRGLMVEHAVPPDAFLDYVHQIDLSVLPESPSLGQALDRLPGRKMIFTNGTKRHAARVTRRLGIDDRFEAVFDIVDSDYLPKPDPVPYDVLVARHGVDPRRAVMVEDIARNLRPAHALGMTTVWVPTESPSSRDGAEDGHIHHVAEDLAHWLVELTG
ncbi:MAG: pyrimidine 5'-nucleotidase [Alphaproteobacteria bacterium]|nr:pyrimidine 5'-nucleotidase [Alphaproteobacteria bacterium]